MDKYWGTVKRFPCVAMNDNIFIQSCRWKIMPSFQKRTVNTSFQKNAPHLNSGFSARSQLYRCPSLHYIPTTPSYREKVFPPRNGLALVTWEKYNKHHTSTPHPFLASIALASIAWKEHAFSFSSNFKTVYPRAVLSRLHICNRAIQLKHHKRDTWKILTKAGMLIDWYFRVAEI